MNRATSARQRAREERLAKIAGGCALVSVLFAIAWADARLLLAIPLIAGVSAYIVRKERLNPPAESDDDLVDDWF